MLVVDDNVDAAVMLAMLLEASGHQVQVEHDPLEALAEDPDLAGGRLQQAGLQGEQLLRHEVIAFDDEMSATWSSLDRK